MTGRPPSDPERDAAFRAARAAVLQAKTAVQRDAAAALVDILGEAIRKIAAILADQPSDWQRWQYARVAAEIRRVLAEINTPAVRSAAEAIDKLWQLGVELVDRPIEAGANLGLPAAADAAAGAAAPAPVRLSTVLPRLDLAQLEGLKAAATHQIKGLSIDLANRVTAQLGQVVAGVATPSQAADQVKRIVGTGGRRRALVIVRTEIGAAFSDAAQLRKEQALPLVPGLKKQWRRSGKLHSRPQHDAIDGQIVDVKAPFNIAGTLFMFPRDPAAPAGERINCGCVSLPHMDGWQMRFPDRRPFTDEEVAGSASKRLLSTAVPLLPDDGT